MVLLCAMNYSAPVKHSPTRWAGGLDDPSGPDDDFTQWTDDPAHELAAPDQTQSDFDPASITVQMSIWQELCAGHPTDQRQVRLNHIHKVF